MILTNEDVLTQWSSRFASLNRKEDDYTCGLGSLFSFYFEVFGLNLDWMRKLQENVFRVNFLMIFAVEISTVLEANPQWTYPHQQFLSWLRHFYRLVFSSVNVFTACFHYRSDSEWEVLVELVGKELFQPGPQMDMAISCSIVAPLIRVLIKQFGIKGAKERLTTLWAQIPGNIYLKGDSPEAKVGLLHCAIELDELPHVERFSYPGIVAWRNSKGKNAIDVAEEKLGEKNSITLHLQQYKTLCESKCVRTGSAEKQTEIEQLRDTINVVVEVESKPISVQIGTNEDKISASEVFCDKNKEKNDVATEGVTNLQSIDSGNNSEDLAKQGERKEILSREDLIAKKLMFEMEMEEKRFKLEESIKLAQIRQEDERLQLEMLRETRLSEEAAQRKEFLDMVKKSMELMRNLLDK